MSELVEIARALRDLQKQVAALQRLEQGSGGGGGLDFDDIHGLGTTTLALADEFAIYDVDATGAKKVTTQEVWDSINKLADGVPGLGDRFPYYDGVTPIAKKSSMASFFNSINDLDDTPIADVTNDYLIYFDGDEFLTAKTNTTDIFAAIKTIDGASSGLDADLLDGNEATAFAAASHAHSGADITSGTVADARIDSAITRDSEVMSIVLANDGSGSGLDADTVDGAHLDTLARRTIIATTDSAAAAIDISQLSMTPVTVPAGGYVTLPNEARFLLAHRTGGSNTSHCLIHLGVGGTIGNIAASGINLTNTGNDCIYWDAGSSTYRIGNNSGGVRTWRVLLIRGS